MKGCQLMNIASVFDWFASESSRAAENTDDLSQREVWSRLALLWAAAAQQSGEAPSQFSPITAGNHGAYAPALS
jgi:hypothetical protein